jgi:hypothetical protein
MVEHVNAGFVTRQILNLIEVFLVARPMQSKLFSQAIRLSL